MAEGGGVGRRAVASPRLAHIYLQYVFDTWVNQWRKKSAQGTGLGSATPTTSSWGSNPGQRRRGEGKPETFHFLGFTHSCGKTRKGGWFTGKRRTITKRLGSKLREIKQELRKRWHARIVDTGKWLGRVVQGYFNYYAVPGSFAALQSFRREIARLWLEALRRRSQRQRMPWKRFAEMVNRYWPRPQILHPEPGARFDANPRGRSRMR